MLLPRRGLACAPIHACATSCNITRCPAAPSIMFSSSSTVNASSSSASSAAAAAAAAPCASAAAPRKVSAQPADGGKYASGRTPSGDGGGVPFGGELAALGMEGSAAAAVCADEAPATAGL